MSFDQSPQRKTWDPRIVREHVARALRTWIAGGQSAKHVARQLGATPRSVENWQDGQSLPQALHLIAAMRESDEVFAVVCELAGRRASLSEEQRALAADTLELLEAP